MLEEKTCQYLGGTISEGEEVCEAETCYVCEDGKMVRKNPSTEF
ncbi:MAG: hypothetical protein AAGU11_19120 [Syntrophobacteraceae bacterium]